MDIFRKSFWFRQHEFCVSIRKYGEKWCGIRKLGLHRYALDIGYYVIVFGHYKWGNIPFKTRKL